MAKNSFSFNTVPRAYRQRNAFDLSHGNSFTCNVGDLVPFDCQEVYPGDTFKTRTSFVIRASSAFVKPVMDVLYADTFCFFVPSRLLMNRWGNVFGDDTPRAYTDPQDQTIPQARIPQGVDLSVGTIADTLGVPSLSSVADKGSIVRYVSQLPFRAVALCYNEFMRNQNIIDPVDIPFYGGNDSDTPVENDLPVLNTNEWSVTNIFGRFPKITKIKDQYTSLLPAPQKGDPVFIPLSTDVVPVRTFSDDLVDNTVINMRTRYTANNGDSMTRYMLTGPYSSDTGSHVAMASITSPTQDQGLGLYPSNLGIDLGRDQVQIDVNDFRLAVQMQKILERSARGGSRYVEYLLSAFGVSAPDQRLQRPEYLGGARTPINVQQVAQTNSGGTESYLADLGAYSLTNGYVSYNKSFVEHGFVISFIAFRQHHSYPQGLEKFWTRKSRFDFYDPTLAHIGEQPTYVDEIYLDAVSTPQNSRILGYNEAFVDLRYRPSRVSGKMRPSASESLDFWNFADSYNSIPTLSPSFINETAEFVDRTLAVSKDTGLPQFIVNAWIQNHAYRVLPLYGTPELVDHF